MRHRTKQLSYWVGEFGDQYVERNRDFSFFQKRRPFFASLLRTVPDVKSVLEVGCNIGVNLGLLHEINPSLELTGIEPNRKAVTLAKKSLPFVSFHNASLFDVKLKATFDLVLTVNLLIHIANQDLMPAVSSIYTAASKYLLIIEYYSKIAETIPYRGLEDALFKRPYDRVLFHLYPNLTMVDKGFLTLDSGFDSCHWWLFKK